MYIIERLTGDIAVIETDDGALHIPRTELPQEADEGDILRKTDRGWEIDHEAAQARRQQLAARRRRLLHGGTPT